MALTPSTMMPLGTIAPDFSLFEPLTRKIRHLEEFISDIATVIVFTCNHCPYVIHIQDKMVEVFKDYQKKGIQCVAICSNNVEKYPQDGPDKMSLRAQEAGFTFPYLYDETQAVAHAYQAACTPDFYVFNSQRRCVYRGRFDGSTPGNTIPVTGEELTKALDQILAHQPIDQQQKPSVGCNIKWKS